MQVLSMEMDGDLEEWLEIHNSGAEAMDLSGYVLSDDLDDLFKWTFPTTTVPADGFKLVWPGKDRIGAYLEPYSI